MKKFYELNEFPLFNHCDNDIISMLISSVSNRISSYKDGDIIAAQGSECRSLLLLCQGSVDTLMTNSEGKELKIETLHAPEVLAPAFLYGKGNLLPVTIKAFGDCKIWMISKDGFLKAMQSSQPLLLNFLQDISGRSQFLSRKLNEFALQSLSMRVLGYMKKHTTIKNLQETAFILGVARPSLSRAIALFVEQGVIVKQKDGYVLKKSSE